MANALITSTVITNEVLRIAHNASAFLGNMNSDYSELWNGQYKPGQSVNARRPVQFTHRTGSTANIQDITESSVPIVVQPELGIDFAVASNELALSVGSNGQVSKEFKQRYLQPAGLKIAAIMDYSIGQIVKNSAHQMVGTPGVPPATVADILNAQVPLDRMSVPRDGMRMAAIEPGANATIVAGLATLFNNQGMLGEQYKSGIIKTSLGLDFAMSQNVPTHTVGPLGGTPLVNGASQGLTNSGSTDNPYAASTLLLALSAPILASRRAIARPACRSFMRPMASASSSLSGSARYSINAAGSSASKMQSVAGLGLPCASARPPNDLSRSSASSSNLSRPHDFASDATTFCRCSTSACCSLIAGASLAASSCTICCSFARVSVSGSLSSCGCLVVSPIELERKPCVLGTCARNSSRWRTKRSILRRARSSSRCSGVFSGFASFSTCSPSVGVSVD